MRGDQPVELTPKGFELLTVMIENHGRLLGKEELMDKIWADSFVEESNLTFNIRQLRKILGDDAQAPKYIKTVRSHGYRFIADVKRISQEDEYKPIEEIKAKEDISVEENEPKENITQIVSQPAEVALSEQPKVLPKTRNFLAPVFVASVILLVGAAVINSWYARSETSQTSAPILSAPFASEKLSTNGQVRFAAVSPDGKNVVYTNSASNGEVSIWLRQLETGDNREIIPPSENLYYDLEFSPDGNTLYFSRLPRLEDEPTALYRVSTFGGIPQKIVNDAFGRVGISPDGKRISFNRRPRSENEYSSLWIADSADGGNERKLASRSSPLHISDSDFSPDGKRIVFSVGQAGNKANEFGLAEVDLETGKEREFTTEKFYVITSLACLPDDSGLLLTAFKFPDNNFRVWKVSAPGGEATPLTKVSEHYEFLSIDKDATKVVSIQAKETFDIRLVNLDNPSEIRNLADGGSASFAPDGKIYFSSTMSGNHEIWSINRDGSNRRQLTNNKDEEYNPVVSSDGSAVYFTSNRSGAARVWRMQPDGSNQTQITHKESGFPLSVTSDGEWLYYLHGIDRTLWRVSLKTGDEQLALNKENYWGFAVSPDNLMAAFQEKQGDEYVLAIAELASGKTIKTFHLPYRKQYLLQIGWMPDGKSLIYISSDQNLESTVLWKQPLNENPPRQFVVLGDKDPTGYTLPVTSDGKTFAAIQQEVLYDVVLLKGLR
jgi:Tol biopolymer transport system component/DNA-binding winged helix-turn-helix (wHTH) protein